MDSLITDTSLIIEVWHVVIVLGVIGVTVIGVAAKVHSTWVTPIHEHNSSVAKWRSEIDQKLKFNDKLWEIHNRSHDQTYDRLDKRLGTIEKRQSQILSEQTNILKEVSHIMGRLSKDRKNT